MKRHDIVKINSKKDENLTGKILGISSIDGEVLVDWSNGIRTWHKPATLKIVKKTVDNE